MNYYSIIDADNSSGCDYNLDVFIYVASSSEIILPDQRHVSIPQMSVQWTI